MANGAVGLFRDVCAQTIYRVIQAGCEGLLKMTPLRMKAKHEKLLEEKTGKKDAMDKDEPKEDADIIRRRMMSVMEELLLSSERRNSYMSLAWTSPSDNSRVQSKDSLRQCRQHGRGHVLRHFDGCLSRGRRGVVACISRG